MNRRRLTPRQLSTLIDCLEPRRLFSAAAVGSISSQSLSVGTTPSAIGVSSYFKDTAIPTGDTVVNFQTNLPAPNNTFPVILSTAATPQTVANFLHYVSSGEYAQEFIHRSVAGFVIQGGGYYNNSGSVGSVSTFADVPGESSTEVFHNTAGTIAMALSTGPNSGNSQWFFNIGDNTSSLDGSGDGGPFTAFGAVIYNGMSVITAVNNLPVVNASSPFDTLPVTSSNAASGGNVTLNDVVYMNPVVDSSPLTFSVTSNKPAVVTAAVTNGSLQLTPVAAGSATITITATDLGGGTATQTIPVTVTGSSAVAPAVSVASASGTIGTDSQIVFPVSLSSAASAAITVNYATTAGTAPAGDFTATAGTLTIPAGQTSAQIDVPILANTTGAAETFTLTLSGINAAGQLPAGSSVATGTINPSPVPVTAVNLSASGSALTLGESDTFTATVTTTAGATVQAGIVDFYANGVMFGSQIVDSTGTATLAETFPASGAEAVTAVYVGDGVNYASATSASVTVAVSTLAPATVTATLPAEIVAGTAARGAAVVTVTNTTANTSTGLTVVRVYASPSGLIDGSATLIGTLPKRLKLAASGVVRLAVPIRFAAATLPAGTYTLLTETVDPNNNVSDATTGPTLKIDPAVVSLSAGITRVTGATKVVAGTRTKAAAVVSITNAGNTNSTGPSTIALYASTDGTVAAGTPIRTLSLPRLVIPKGRTVNVSVPLGTYPPVTDGDYLIVAQVTDGKQNAATAVSAATINIAAAKVDLTATATTVTAAGKIGRPVVVSVTFTNNGNVTAAGIVSVVVQLSSSTGGTNPSAVVVPLRVALPAGRTETARLKVVIPAETLADSYFVQTTVDSTNVLGEPNLADNVVTSPAVVVIS